MNLGKFVPQVVHSSSVNRKVALFLGDIATVKADAIVITSNLFLLAEKSGGTHPWMLL